MALSKGDFPGRPHRNTIVRWATTGCYGVRLKTVRFGGKRLTRKVWVDEFNERVLENSPSFQMDTADPAEAEEAENFSAPSEAAAKPDSMGIK